MYIILFLIGKRSGGQTNNLLHESPLNEPPKCGFVPRMKDQGLSHRDAIRHTSSSAVMNSQWAQPAPTENCSHSLASCTHKDISTHSDCTSSSFLQSQADSGTYGHRSQSCGSPGFIAGRVRQEAPSFLLGLFVPSHLNQYYVVEFDKHGRPMESATAMDSVTNVQFDSLRSEPQLII